MCWDRMADTESAIFVYSSLRDVTVYVLSVQMPTCFVVPNFATASACAEIRAAMDCGETSRAEIHADGYQVDETVRRSFDISVDAQTVATTQQLIASAQAKVAAYFACVLTGQEGPGFLRYATGGFYRVHSDVIPGAAAEFTRRISVILFLTSAGLEDGPGECEGGTLRLYAPSQSKSEHSVLEIVPVAGTLVAFHATLPHEVLPVTAGVRDVIVDWFY